MRGPLEISQTPRLAVLWLRRYLCRCCQASMTVGPLGLVAHRLFSIAALGLSASTPDKPPPSVVVEGELCRAHEAAQDGEQTVSAERVTTFDEGIDYDKSIVVQLDQAADDGNPRLWLSAPVCLIVSSEAGVPVRVETEGGSEYLITVL